MVGLLRGIKELVEVLLLWGFIYVMSFLVLIVFIIYFITSRSTQEITISESQKIVMNEPIKDIGEVCNRIDGCRIIRGVCIDCESINYKISQ